MRHMAGANQITGDADRGCAISIYSSDARDGYMDQYAGNNLRSDHGLLVLNYCLNRPAFGHHNPSVPTRLALTDPSKDIPRSVLLSDTAADECLIMWVHTDRYHPAGQDGPS